jgi:hypothetical protein
MEGAEEVKKDANEEKPMEGVESSQAQEPETTPGKYTNSTKFNLFVR